MTINEYFQSELISKDQKRKKGFYILLASVIFFYISIPISMILKFFDLELIFNIFQGMNLIVGIIFYYGITIYLFSIFSLKKVIICPECNKSLSYLVTDSSYSKKFIFLGIPHSLPEEIDICPFCKVNLNTEIKK
jgi:hypothetical protein